MSDGAKCDFCDKPAIAVAGDTNGLLVCGDHNGSPDLTPGHGGNAGLCTDDHVCPGCEVGGMCVDLFEHPACGVVACCADEVTDREHHPECYQRTGVPDDMPAGICDCRVLRMLDAAAVTARCIWGERGLPACQPGIRDRRHWCAPCVAKESR